MADASDQPDARCSSAAALTVDPVSVASSAAEVASLSRTASLSLSSAMPRAAGAQRPLAPRAALAALGAERASCVLKKRQRRAWQLRILSNAPQRA
jgi:hypothetical protein